MRFRAELTRLMRFGGASLFGTAAHYGVLVVLVEAARFSPVPSSALGFVVGALVNYVLSRRWAFAEHRGAHTVAVAKFLLVAASGWVLNGALMYLGVEIAAVPYLIAQIVTTGLLFFWHYALNRLWTFR